MIFTDKILLLNFENMKKTVLILLVWLSIGFSSVGQEVKLVLNKPFDINKIESIESGPKDHIYALSSDKKLALIRFNTVFDADTIRLI